MIYKILKYKIILLVVIFFSLLLSFSYKQLLSFSKLNKEIQNKSNYLEKKDNSVSAPLLCFQGAYKLNKSTFQIVGLLRIIFESRKLTLYPNLKPHESDDDVNIE